METGPTVSFDFPAGMGKNLRVFGARGSLIGDSVVALTVYALLRKHHPNCYTFWQVARKCSQAAPLFYNHPLIDNLVISDCKEGMGPRDWELAGTCQGVFNVMPTHPEGDGWPNIRSMYHETFRMSGLTDQDWVHLAPEEQRPHLVKWFEIERQPKSIALWPSARQGEKQKRTASWQWFASLRLRLAGEGYKVYHCGHPNDFEGWGPLGYDVRELSFMNQIKLSLSTDLIIGTDSGSLLALAAYENTPSISLITNHYPGHTQNLHAFAPQSPLNQVLFAPDDPDNISIDSVVQVAKEMT